MAPAPDPRRAYDLLERLSHLLRAAERAAGASEGLQPVHLHALRYLARANRYSDTLSGLAEYLGVTKGTTSQTVGVLQQRGLVEGVPDGRDGRVVHLRPTRRGARLIARLVPPEPFRAALAAPAGRDGASLAERLESLLRAAQLAHGSRPFGVCHTCRFHERVGDATRCGLTGEPLRAAERELICREHEPAPA